jgi:hypothetical protein
MHDTRLIVALPAFVLTASKGRRDKSQEARYHERFPLERVGYGGSEWPSFMQ